jgi:hypothetical protein
MAALAPFAQVIADMDGLNSIGACRGSVCVHRENLPCEFRGFHYLRRNRIAETPGSSSQLSSPPSTKETCHDPSIPVASPRHPG